MKFEKGESGNPGGRPKGAVNQITKTVKETVLAVFNELQADPKHNLKAFAQKFPRDYYNIAAKLIPTEVKAEVYTPEGIQIVFEPADKCKAIGNNPDDTKAD